MFEPAVLQFFFDTWLVVLFISYFQCFQADDDDDDDDEDDESYEDDDDDDDDDDDEDEEEEEEKEKKWMMPVSWKCHFRCHRVFKIGNKKYCRQPKNWPIFCWSVRGHSRPF